VARRGVATWILFPAPKLAFVAARGLVRLSVRQYNKAFRPVLPEARRPIGHMVDQQGWYSRPFDREQRMPRMELPPNPRTWSPTQRDYATRQQLPQILREYARERGGTAWTGGVAIAQPGHVGGPGRDGTMYLHHKEAAQLERMVEKAGKRQLGRTKKQHMMVLSSMNESQVSFRLWKGNFRELGHDGRGSTDVWRHGIAKEIAKNERGDFVRSNGFDQLAKGLDKVKVVDRNPLYSAAVQRITSDLSKKTGMAPQDVLQRLGDEPNGEPWNVAADMVMDHSGLNARIQDPNERLAVRDKIAEAYRQPLDNLGATNTAEMKRGAIRRLSARAGRGATSTVDHIVKQELKSRDQQVQGMQQQTTMDHGRWSGDRQELTNQMAHNAVQDVQRDPALAQPQIVDAHGRPHTPAGGERPTAHLPSAPATPHREGNTRGG
jgi:hypothetical protein